MPLPAEPVVQHKGSDTIGVAPLGHLLSLVAERQAAVASSGADHQG